jgi:tetratricopeptide (TPR) repeat protein
MSAAGPDAPVDEASDFRRATPPAPRPATGLSTPGTGAGWPRGVWLALYVMAALAIYWPALRGELLLDDPLYIPSAALGSWDGLRRIWCDVGATQQYYPVLFTGFWVEHRAWGDAVLGYHLANVLEHAVAAWLLALLVQRLKLRGGWLAGLVFLAHPIAVESVAWIAEQKNTLSTAAALGAALAYVGFAESGRRWQYALATAAFVFALLTKSNTAVVPAVLVIVLGWRYPGHWRKHILPLTPWLVAGAAFGLFSAWLERRHVGAIGPDFSTGILERVGVAVRAAWFHAGKLAWPAHLSFVYPRWETDLASWPVASAVIVTLAAAAVGWRYASRGVIAAVAVYGVVLFPTSGLLNVYWHRFSWVADHFAYLAALVFAVGVAHVLAGGMGHGARWRRLAWSLFTPCALGLLAATSFRRTAVYASHEQLCRATLAENPSAWLMHHNLAVELGKQGRQGEAIAELRETIRLKADFADAYFNLGRALEQEPVAAAEAIQAYETAVQLSPEDGVASFNLANALARAGRMNEAVAAYARAAQSNPTAELYFNFANAVDAGTGDRRRARALLETALRLDPTYANAEAELGEWLLADDVVAAIGHLQRAVAIRPRSAESLFSLANAYASGGKAREAIDAYDAVLRIDPASVEAAYNRACVLLQLVGERSAAIAAFRDILHRRPDFEPARRQLGALGVSP